MNTVQIGAITVNDLRHSLTRHATLTPPVRTMDQIIGVAIHNTGPPVHREFTSEELAAYHVNSNGWPCIGYSLVVHMDGVIDYALDWNRVGWHVGGQNNWTYMGICLTGWFDDGRQPTEAQISATRDLIANLGMAFGRQLAVKAHKELWATVCPGTTWPGWKDRLTITIPPAPAPPEPDTLRAVFDDLWALSEDTHPAVMRAKQLIGGWQ